MKKIIKALVPRCLKEKIRKKGWLLTEDKIIWGGQTFKYFLDTAVNDFDVDKKRLRRLLPDIKKSYCTYGIRPHEYFMFKFEDKTPQERTPYLSDKTKDKLLIQYYGNNWKARLDLTKDKYGLYQHLKKFYNREIVLLTGRDDKEEFRNFCLHNDSFMVKPLKGGGGKGIKIIHLKNHNQIDLVYDELIADGPYVIEELIQQDSRLSEFNSSSLNTLRIPSFRHGDMVKLWYPFLRFGRNGSVIDNATSGGVFALVDLNSGELISDAYDKSGHVYEQHPDSKKKFKGYKIPEWDQLFEVVKAAHLSLSEKDVYVAFDVALSTKGWVIIEGNWGDIMCQQIALKRGLYDEFVDILNKEI